MQLKTVVLALLSVTATVDASVLRSRDSIDIGLARRQNKFGGGGFGGGNGQGQNNGQNAGQGQNNNAAQGQNQNNAGNNGNNGGNNGGNNSESLPAIT